VETKGEIIPPDMRESEGERPAVSPKTGLVK